MNVKENDEEIFEELDENPYMLQNNSKDNTKKQKTVKYAQQSSVESQSITDDYKDASFLDIDQEDERQVKLKGVHKKSKT